MSYVNFPYPGWNPHLVASPLINVLALPLVDGLGTLATYNILLLGGIALSWPAAALLCYEVFPDRWAATVGAAVYAFYPNKIAHAVGGHLAQTFVFLFPLTVLFLFRAWKAPQNRSNSLLAGLLLGLSLLVDLKHIALFIAPFVALFLVFYGVVERRAWGRARVGSLAVAFAIGGLVSGPFLMPLILGRLNGQLEHFAAPGVIRHSADLTSFLVPPPEHPIYSSWESLRSYSTELAWEGWHENIFYLGIVTLVLSAVSVWRLRRRRDVQFWGLVAMCGIILALGPVLKVGGAPVSFRVAGGIRHVPLPYAILQALPFYDWGRTPGRIVEMTMLALAVLSAGGTTVLFGDTQSRYRSLLVLGVVAAILIDTLFVWPWPVGDARVPRFYRQISQERGQYAILDLPIWEYRCEQYQLYYATVHERPIVGGLVTRREAERSMQKLEQLVQPTGQPRTAAAFRAMGIRYVVLHKLCLPEDDLEEKSELLTSSLGAEVYDDEWIRAFQVPGDPSLPVDWPRRQ
jgi:4-amino-4-deoxy-L-arabinose transferase-like glycosyltransferase